jgi:3-methyladenine DNA glycosylase AlkD
MATRVTDIMEELRSHGNPEAVAGMARYGIRPRRALGVSLPVLRRMGKRIGKDHKLAMQLWRTGTHEARILASLVADPASMDDRTAARWLHDCDSWDIVDQCCGNLFARMASAYANALVWSRSKSEYVKRGGFALMAWLAVRDKKSPDGAFLRLLPAIRRGSRDGRNLVKKGVNWALRQIGKRNVKLHRRALELACQLAASSDAAARWVGTDALRELVRPDIMHRLKDLKQ